MKGLNTSPSVPVPKEAPLWRRTQLRLQNMETWSAQRRLTSSGFDERIQLQDERIQLACRHLVLLLKEREDASDKTRGLTDGLD